MATAKECHTQTSYYIRKYKEKYDVLPLVNRYTARYGFDSILMDMTPKEVKALLDFFFTLENRKRHSLDWFLRNYEKLVALRDEVEQDKLNRAKLRRESEKRAREWRERNGNSGIEGN